MSVEHSEKKTRPSLLDDAVLKSEHEKIVLAGSRTVSTRLLYGHSHFNAQAHSLRTFAESLYEHPTLSAFPLNQISGPERALLAQAVGRSLSEANYFKKAFELPGLAAVLFSCLDELRMAAFNAGDLPAAKSKSTRSKSKSDSVAEVYDIYITKLKDAGIVDYPAIVPVLTAALNAGRYNEILKNTRIFIPLELELLGGERELLKALENTCGVFFQPPKFLCSPTVPKNSDLETFKETLRLTLMEDSRRAVAEKTQIDDSIRVKSSLTADATVASILDWMRERRSLTSETSVATIDYDHTAGALYRRCLEFDIPLNLVRGLRATEFKFCAKDLEQINSIWEELLFEGKAKSFIERATKFFQKRHCDHLAYSAFRAIALDCLKSCSSAEVKFGTPDADSFAIDTLRKTLLDARFYNADLGLAAHGLTYGRPEDLIGECSRHLAIIGLQDHDYPTRRMQNPILKDDERLALNHILPRQNHCALALSTDPIPAGGILERRCLTASHSLYLGFISHDLGSGSLTFQRPLLQRRAWAQNDNKIATGTKLGRFLCPRILINTYRVPIRGENWRSKYL